MKKTPKHFIATTVAATLAVPTVSPMMTTAQEVTEQIQPPVQLIVKATEKANITELTKVIDDVTVIDATNELTVIEVQHDAVKQVTASLLQHDGIDYVEENATYQIAATATNDTYAESLWNLKAIHAEEAWADLGNTKLSEEDVVVAVLDTGVQATHEDLQGRILPGRTFVDGEEATNAHGEDDQGHGTFVSGLIVANADNEVGIAGVTGNQNVKVLPVKVMDKRGSGTAVDIAKGIDYAIEQGADVINMSISGEYSETIEQAVQRAADEGIVVVAASGNGGGNADQSFPAALPNVISVAALATNDQHYTRSNVGESVDIAAPGAGVLSTSMSSDKYITSSGTSYATPHVAAVAALYKLKYPHASAVEIEEALKVSAVDLGDEGWDPKTGYGKIDAAAALAGNIAIKTLHMTSPKAHADLLGTTKVQLSISDTSKVAALHIYAHNIKIATVDQPENIASFEWDTTAFADGDVVLKAVALAEDGEILEETTRTVTIFNDAQSGYMFDVKTPAGTIAKAASVLLYEKVENEDGTHTYRELWNGRTNDDGVVRVPSHIGTDLKSLQVVVQGTFDAEEGNTWFMYNREVSSVGTVELSSEHTVPVHLSSTNTTGDFVTDAEYFITMQDADGVELTLPRKINTSATDKAPTVYIDKGTYNIYSHFKQQSNTYFLTAANQVVTDNMTLQFDAANTGQVAVAQADNSHLENAVLYLYNDDVSNIFGSSEVLTGQKFFVTPGEYQYIVDAEVAGDEGEENWIYVFANNKQTAIVEQGKQTNVHVGGNLHISHFDVDQDSLRRYYTQRKLSYIERDSEYDMYRADGVVYSKHEFSDAYGNMLIGLRRGSIESQDAIYQKDVHSGETKAIGDTIDNTKVTSIDFGDIYPTYQFKNIDDNTVILNSHEKNPTNPANRGYYTYGFATVTAAAVKPGNYELSVSLAPTPLAPEGLFQSFNTQMKNSARTLKLQDAEGTLKSTYVTIMSPVKDAQGNYNMQAQFTSNSNRVDQSLTIPTNLHLSDEPNSNVAIIRYVTTNNEFAYLFKTFTSIEELNTTLTIPDNMQRVQINAYNDEEALSGVSTKQWLIKQAVEIDGETVYATANNLQNYRHDAIHLEPGTFTFEGNYVSVPNAELERKNYYFLNPDVTIDDTDNNEVRFNTKDLAKVTIDANTEGFNDVRGAMLYPYNQYSNSFTSTLRVGHEFYVPANIEMNLQAQLGYGDTESTNKIWNYFLLKGKQTFAVNEETTWQVGGSFKADVSLAQTSFNQGDVILNGHTAIEDSHGNKITSVLINETSDYSISADAATTYALVNGETIEVMADDKGLYTVATSTTTAHPNSFKPVFTVYDEQNNPVLKRADLAFYTELSQMMLPSLPVGTYTASLAFAASPHGPISDSETFTVNMPSPPIEETPGDNTVVFPSMPPIDNGITPPAPEDNDETTTEEAVTTQEISADSVEGQETLHLVLNDVSIALPTKQLTTVDHIVNVTEKNGVLTFSAATKDTQLPVEFDDYVQLTFSASALTNESHFNMVRLLEDGTKASVPHTIEDGIVKLSVHTGGTFTISTEKKDFVDIIKDGHAPYITALANRLIIQGKTADTFEPNSTTTRAQFAAILARALDMKAQHETLFTDTKGQWFEQDVQALVETGIVKGKSPQIFDPNVAITRQQAAVMMMRLVNYLQIDTSTVMQDVQPFTDFHQISTEGQQAVTVLQQLGIFTGKEDGSFDPNGQLTRSQMAKIVHNVLKIGGML